MNIPNNTEKKQRKPHKLDVRGMAILRDYVVHYNETHDVDATTAMTPQKARQSEEFRNVMKWLRYKSDKPGGRKAQALELLGEREREYEIDRGDDD